MSHNAHGIAGRNCEYVEGLAIDEKGGRSWSSSSSIVDDNDDHHHLGFRRPPQPSFRSLGSDVMKEEDWRDGSTL